MTGLEDDGFRVVTTPPFLTVAVDYLTDPAEVRSMAVVFRGIARRMAGAGHRDADVAINAEIANELEGYATRLEESREVVGHKLVADIEGMLTDDDQS